VGLRVVVVGIPGVGKSTVVDKLISNYPGARLLNFGTFMFEEAVARKWVKDRDQMRKMPVEKQKQLQKAAAVTISRSKAKVAVVDTHLFIRTHEGFWPGLPFDVVRALRPTHLVLVEAAPQEIMTRRSADKTRIRDKITVEGMREELQLARSFLAVSSTLTGAPMHIVNNGDGKADEVAASISTMLRSASA
jgi:adenylate kinase